MLYKGFVVSLPIGTKGAAKQEDVGEQGIPMGFLVEGFLVLGGEGPFAGEEEGTVVVGEVVIKFWTEAKVNSRGGG